MPSRTSRRLARALCVFVATGTLAASVFARGPADDAAAPPAAPAKPVQVRMTTSMGDIVIELDPVAAPLSVANFLQYVDDEFYDGTVFHRVIEGFMIQGGGFDADMKKRPTRAAIENESFNGRSNARGTVAMARTGAPHSATSQFYINVVDNPALDGNADASKHGYAVFGTVVQGMDVVDRIKAVSTTTKGPYRDVPETPVVIESVRRVEPGAKDAKPAPAAEGAGSTSGGAGQAEGGVSRD